MSHQAQEVRDTQERWLPLPGYEGIYEVSDLGRIKRLTFRTRHYPDRPSARAPLIVRLHPCRYGYTYAHITDAGGKKHKAYVHSAVAAAFLGPRPDGMHTAHLDGTRTNASLSNLAYVTPKENEAHKILHGTKTIIRGEQKGNSKLTERDVLLIRRIKALTDGLLSNTQVGAIFGVSREQVRKAWRGGAWDHVPSE